MRLVLFILFCFSTVTAQTTLKGFVYGSKTGLPIMNATVYLDGTSIGAVTGPDGSFSLKKPDDINSDLIVSVLGYEKMIIREPESKDLSKIILTQKTDVLDEVVLELDPWSRKKKLAYFKQQFLGTISWAQRCEIENIDKVRLRFNPSTELLTAVCDEPIIIHNKHLGYTIYYDLADFEVQFKSYKTRKEDPVKRRTVEELGYVMKGTFFLGSSFFTEYDGRSPSVKRREKRRAKAYELSDLRFFRALANNNLSQEGYQLFWRGNPVPIKEHLNVSKIQGYSKVNFRHKKYDFLINKDYQSFFLASGQTVIDQYGNSLTGKSLSFGGYISNIKISGLLPLDYGIKKSATE